MSIAKAFELGSLITTSAISNMDAVDFVAHKSFPGVALKRLVGGEETNHALSLHLVRVDPYCCLENHTHPDNLEIHKVIAGSGDVELGGNSSEYHVGTVGVIPKGTAHKVTAGKNGIYILATFSPALA